MSIDNLDNFGFEPINQNKNISKNQNQDLNTSDKAVDFSKKVIIALQAKLKEHNGSNTKKVTLKQLKSVYRSTSSICSENKDLGEVAMAKVNMFLRIMSGAKVKNLENNISKASINNYLVESTLDPENVDFDLAKEDIKKHGLDFFKFSHAEELYLNDEEDRIFYKF
jgi:hypothetical protein